MNCTYSFRAARRLHPWACLLIVLLVFWGGCQTKEPTLSKGAHALKKELLEEMNKLTTLLIEPVSKQDWDAVKTVLKKSYEEMEQGGKLVGSYISVIDRDGIRQVIYPSVEGRRWDYSSYKEFKESVEKQKKLPFTVYVKETKWSGLIAPIVKKKEVIGNFVISFPVENLEKKWNISEKEFLIINFN
jgi:hypothetical protein